MKNNWLMPWKVINIRKVCESIANGYFDEHPVYNEWKYYFLEKSMGNDKGVLDSVGSDKNIPMINNFLLKNGFKEGEIVIFYVSL